MDDARAFETAGFDVVTMWAVVEHIQADSVTMAEVLG
jgi:hypothetical protein